MSHLHEASSIITVPQPPLSLIPINYSWAVQWLTICLGWSLCKLKKLCNRFATYLHTMLNSPYQPPLVQCLWGFMLGFFGGLAFLCKYKTRKDTKANLNKHISISAHWKFLLMERLTISRPWIYPWSPINVLNTFPSLIKTSFKYLSNPASHPCFRPLRMTSANCGSDDELIMAAWTSHALQRDRNTSCTGAQMADQPISVLLHSTQNGQRLQMVSLSLFRM